MPAYIPELHESLLSVPMHRAYTFKWIFHIRVVTFRYPSFLQLKARALFSLQVMKINHFSLLIPA